MTEKQNFLRIVKAMYETIISIDYSNKETKIDKLKELNRFLTEFEIQTNQIEKMLDTYISLGLIEIQEKEEVIEAVKQINGEYLSSFNV